MTAVSAVDELRMRGDIVWENERYGAVYLVDRPSLLAYLASHLPVLHLGQADAVDAVMGRRRPWLGWWLTCGVPGRWQRVDSWNVAAQMWRQGCEHGMRRPPFRTRTWRSTRQKPPLWSLRGSFGAASLSYHHRL
jgi:hypothetical protein